MHFPWLSVALLAWFLRRSSHALSLSSTIRRPSTGVLFTPHGLRLRWSILDQGSNARILSIETSDHWMGWTWFMRPLALHLAYSALRFPSVMQDLIQRLLHKRQERWGGQSVDHRLKYRHWQRWFFSASVVHTRWCGWDPPANRWEQRPWLGRGQKRPADQSPALGGFTTVIVTSNPTVWKTFLSSSVLCSSSIVISNIWVSITRAGRTSQCPPGTISFVAGQRFAVVSEAGNDRAPDRLQLGNHSGNTPRRSWDLPPSNRKAKCTSWHTYIYYQAQILARYACSDLVPEYFSWSASGMWSDCRKCAQHETLWLMLRDLDSTKRTITIENRIVSSGHGSVNVPRVGILPIYRLSISSSDSLGVFNVWKECSRVVAMSSNSFKRCEMILKIWPVRFHDIWFLWYHVQRCKAHLLWRQWFRL